MRYTKEVKDLKVSYAYLNESIFPKHSLVYAYSSEFLKRFFSSKFSFEAMFADLYSVWVTPLVNLSSSRST